MNVATVLASVLGGSPWFGRPMKRCASAKFATPATSRTASFQSGNDRDEENGTGAGCLYSQMVETRYGTFSSKMFSASSVRPPQAELYSALMGLPPYVAITPRVSATA